MNLAALVLILTALLTFFNTGLQYYTTVSTYPLFSALAAENFLAYHKAYERRLPLAIYAPYTLMMLATALLAFVRPTSVALVWVLVLFVLNGSIMAVSLIFAAPVHAQLDRTGKDEGKLQLLRRYNLPRLLAATASSVILCALLVQSFFE